MIRPSMVSHLDRWFSSFVQILKTPRIQAGLAGLLLGMAFPPFGQFYLVPVALVVLVRALRKAPPEKYVHCTAGFGFFFFLIHTYWFVNFHPLAFPGVLIVTSVLYGLWGYSLRWFGTSPWSLAGSWILLQLMIGSGPLAFPWSRLGTAFAASPVLVQSVYYTGELILGGTIVLVCAAWAYPGKRTYLPARTVGTLLAVGLVVLGIWRFTTTDLQTDPFETLLVQPGVLSTFGGQNTSGELKRTLFELTVENAGGEDLVVWPETVLTGFPFRIHGGTSSLRYRDPDVRETFGRIVPADGHLLAGLPIYDPKENQPDYMNAAVVLDGQAEPIGHYTKNFMVPFGEYIPGMGRWDIVDRLARAVGTLGYRSGNWTEPIRIEADNREYNVGVQICYEDAFPKYVRDQVLRGSNLLVNISNDSWSRSYASHWQHFYRAKLRAIESGRTLLRNGNTGVSAVISPLGTTEDLLEPFETGVLRGETFEPMEMSPIVEYQGWSTGGFLVLLLSFGWLRSENLF